MKRKSLIAEQRKIVTRVSQLIDMTMQVKTGIECGFHLIVEIGGSVHITSNLSHADVADLLREALKRHLAEIQPEAKLRAIQ